MSRFTIYSETLRVTAPISVNDTDGEVISEEISDLIDKSKDAIINALKEKFPTIEFGISSE